VGGDPVVVVIDDLDELDNTSAALPLTTLIHRGRDGASASSRRAASGGAVVLAALRELRREKHGLLLEPISSPTGTSSGCNFRGAPG
jgi:hypothetical protein